jgi:hypothetical protein
VGLIDLFDAIEGHKAESPEGLMPEGANDSTKSYFVHWSKLTSEERQAIIPTIKAGHPVRIFSEVLGESVYWVHGEQTVERLKRAPDYQGEVCYTLAELRELVGQSPELLRDIHRLKRGFGATEETERRAADKPQFATRAFLYGVIRDGRVERATLVSQDIRTEPAALEHLRQRFPCLKVQWAQLITHPVCSGCQHYTGGVLCNADRSPEHVVKVGRCGRYEAACPVSEARS